MALLASYNFDETSGAVVTDYSGNGRNPTLTDSSAQRDAGKNGSGSVTAQAALMSDSTAAGHSGVAVYTSAVRAFSAWVYFDASFAAGSYPVMFMDAGTGNSAFGFYTNDSQVFARFRNSSNGSYGNLFANLSSLHGWHHWALSVNSSTIAQMWLDGASVGTFAISGTIRATADDVLMVDSDAAGWLVDDLRIYDASVDSTQVASDMATAVVSTASVDIPLSFAGHAIQSVRMAGHDIAVIYANGVQVWESPEGPATPSTPLAAYGFDEASGADAVDHSGNGRDVPVLAGQRGSPGHGDSGSYAGAILELAGGDSGVSMSTYETSSRSFTCWAQVYETGTTEFWLVRWAQSAGDDLPGTFGIFIGNGKSTARTITAAGAQTSEDMGGYTAGWHHFAETYDAASGAVKAYVDGVVVASWSLALGTSLKTATILDVDGFGFDGIGVPIDDVRIYGEAIARDQVVSDMNTPVG